MRKQYLNLGCGDRFHPDWENVDLYPTGPGVRVYDLRNRTPYADGTFDVVYHSHVLEHFPKQAAVAFLRECQRVLKPGGVIRVAVPDLERIARLYLEALEKASSGEPGWGNNHEWMVMEMFDQCVRDGPCGAFVEYFERGPIPNWDFIVQRWGSYATRFLEDFRRSDPSRESPRSTSERAWGYILHNPGTVLRNKIVRMLIGEEDWKAIPVGRFRRAGGLHMWMYDNYSLGRLLENVGFRDPQRLTPTESRIPGWASFNLDTDPDGCIYKADSIYMEAVKQ
jgi:predicted SAM-dependent methyltransferase